METQTTINVSETPTIAAEELLVVNDKCSYRSCRVRGAEKMQCAASNCSKLVHYMCYQGFLVMKHDDIELLPNAAVACTKKCHKKALQELSGGGEEEGGRKGNWDSDGKNGPNDKHTSMHILLDWWMTEGNYVKFCGKKNDGVRKIHFANMLARKMSNETNTLRDGKSVLNKIQHIERSFKAAHEFATSETGAGICDNDGVTAFEDIVKKKCTYYYDIVDIMVDRASTQPKATNYDNDSDLDPEEEEEEDEDDDDENYVRVQQCSGRSTTLLSDMSDDEEDEEEQTAAAGCRSASAASGRRGNTTSSTSTPTPVPVPAAAASVGTKRTAASATSKKMKRGRKNSPSLIDDNALAVLGKANETATQRMAELRRHNQALEEIERKREEREALRLSLEQNKFNTMAWKGKNDELDYKMNLLQRYEQLKNTFGWTDAQIIRFYPDMLQVIEARTVVPSPQNLAQTQETIDLNDDNNSSK